MIADCFETSSQHFVLVASSRFLGSTESNTHFLTVAALSRPLLPLSVNPSRRGCRTKGKAFIVLMHMHTLHVLRAEARRRDCAAVGLHCISGSDSKKSTFRRGLPAGRWCRCRALPGRAALVVCCEAREGSLCALRETSPNRLLIHVSPRCFIFLRTLLRSTRSFGLALGRDPFLFLPRACLHAVLSGDPLTRRCRRVVPCC